MDIEVRPILTREYRLPAERPHFSVLDKSKIRGRFKSIYHTGEKN